MHFTNNRLISSIVNWSDSRPTYHTVIQLSGEQGTSVKMIPFVFKQRDYEDPEVKIGYKKVRAAYLRVSGLYPCLMGNYYYVFGLYGFYLHFIFTLYLVAYYTSVVLAVIYSDMDILVLNLCFALLTSMYFVVLHHGMYNRDLVDELLKIVGKGFFTYERPSTPDELEILRKADVHCLHNMYRDILIAIAIVVCQCLLLPLPHGIRGDYSTIVEGGIPINKHVSLPVWVPFDTNTPVKFWFITLMFANDAATETRIISSACTFYCNLCTALASQFDLLSDSLRNLEARAIYSFELHGYGGKRSEDEYYDDPRFQVILNKCLDENIQHHQVLQDFNSKLQTYVGPAVFAILSGMALTISAPMYQLVSLAKTNEEITVDLVINTIVFTSFIISFTMYLYFYCCYGQRVTSASERLHFALYESPWVRANTSFRQKLIITMNKCEKPIVVEMLGLVSATSATFLDVVKTIFSYCNLLLATSGDE